jgi:predicted nuclease with RNAse H fold
MASIPIRRSASTVSSRTASIRSTVDDLAVFAVVAADTPLSSHAGADARQALHRSVRRPLRSGLSALPPLDRRQQAVNSGGLVEEGE